MININLLSWRDELRKRESRFFLTMLSFFILGTFVICVFVYFYSSYRAHSLGPNKELLNKAVQSADQEIAKLSQYATLEKNLKNETQLLEAINYNRLLPLALLNNVAKSLPKSVYLDRIEMRSGQLLLSGTAQTNQQISQFINELKQYPEISFPVLKEAKTVSENDAVTIKFEVDATIFPVKPIPESKPNAKA